MTANDIATWLNYEASRGDEPRASTLRGIAGEVLSLGMAHAAEVDDLRRRLRALECFHEGHARAGAQALREEREKLVAARRALDEVVL